MSQYRLIKIHELPEQVTVNPTQYVAIDVPDPLSPTGYTTKKISATILGSGSIQDLASVLSVGFNTGANPIEVDELSAIVFENGTFNQNLIRSGNVLGSDVFVKMPDETGQIQLELDTIEKPINLFNGSFGLANTGNSAYRPNISVRNRTVFINGQYIIPMPTVAGGSILDTNAIGYVTNYYSDLYQGANPDAFTIDGRNIAFSNSPIIPADLCPVYPVRMSHDYSQTLLRTVNLNGRTRLNTFSGFVLLPDGRMIFGGVENWERNGLTSSGFTKSMQMRKIIDRFQNGDSMFEYDNYFNSFDGTFTTDKRTVQDTGVNWNFDHDGTRSNDFGGYVTSFNLSYQLPPNRTLKQIENAFNSI